MSRLRELRNERAMRRARIAYLRELIELLDRMDRGLVNPGDRPGGDVGLTLWRAEVVGEIRSIQEEVL